MVKLRSISILCVWSAVSLLLASCASESGSLSYTLDSFQAGNLVEKSTIECETLGIMNPAALRLLDSGDLVLLDRKAPKQLKIIGKDGTLSVELMSRGRGPGEAVTPWDLASRGSYVWVSDISARKLLRFSRSDGGFSYADEIRLSDQFMRALPFRDSLVLTVASSSSKNRMCLIGPSGAAVDTVGTFPYSESIRNDCLNNSIFQSDIAVSPDCGKVVVTCKSFNVIDVYDADFQGSRRLMGPRNIEVGVESKDLPIGVVFSQNPFMRIFEGVSAGDKYFMVGYVGAYDADEVNSEKAISALLCFDYKGRPVRLYNLPVQARSFDVDWKNNRVYCLTSQDSPEILTYELGNV
jgi:hypothetical protein